ncbi:MAG TPA: tetratricopeptide repeat protein [Pyrinomonadaceae bacterium]|jgi:tetratricopeptide (TPR) repeat protein|nr:tetratricopeptide repeat protein [Pyrinomonadaceae bacterium]
MIPASAHAVNVQRACSLFCTVLLVALFAAAAQAQSANGGIDSDPGFGMKRGTNVIDGRVFLPSGQRVEKRLTVRLSSVVVGEFSTMTDSNGAFVFRRLREGTYYVTVEAGKEYLPASETVIFFDNRGQVQTVQFDLQLKPTDRSKPGVVNAALAGVPKVALDYYKQALESATAGDSKKAIEQLKSAISMYSDFAAAYNEMGVQYQKLGDLDKAIEAFRSGVKIAPDAFVLRLNYGYVLMQKKQFVQAEAELRRALELKPSSATGHLYYGKVFIKLGKYPEAEKELQQVISLGGEDVIMAHRYLGALYIEQKKNAQAAESLEKYLSLAPKAKDADQVREIVKQLRAQK